MAEAEPFGSDAEFRDAERKVMHPETDVTSVRLGGVVLRLRPLPLGAATKLATIAEAAFVQVRSDDAASRAKAIGEALIDAMLIIAELYKVPGASRPWIEENVDDGEAFDVLEAQLAAGTRNSFLRRGVRPILKLVRETFEELEATDFAGVKQSIAQAFSSQEKPASSPASASPGESPYPSSSIVIPRASSS